MPCIRKQKISIFKECSLKTKIDVTEAIHVKLVMVACSSSRDVPLVPYGNTEEISTGLYTQMK